MDTLFKDTISFIREIYKTEDYIPLHEPRFLGNEKAYLNECIDSTFVSSVGKYVDRFEEDVAVFTGAKYAVAVVNGTQALFIGLKLSGVGPNTEVVTQSLSFVATANAISYTGASPIFLDVDRDTMGLSPNSLRGYLEKNTKQIQNRCINKKTNKQIVACVPMHTFGHPCRILEIKKICDEFNLVLVEDAAESLGSFSEDRHTGCFGKLGILSFNGNKIITTGAGGMIITDDEVLAQKAKHITTTAKTPHPWEFIHDEIGHNYRMPNLNAALGVAQLQQLNGFLENKRELAQKYATYFEGKKIRFISGLPGTASNYWLNAILCEDTKQQESFLTFSNQNNVMTRSIWRPMHLLSMYQNREKDDLSNTEYLYRRVVNIPSSVVVS